MLILSRGQHESPAQGVNLLEHVSQIAGLKFTDYPEGVSPVLAAFLRDFCDDCRDSFRPRLADLAQPLVGSYRGPELETRRAWIVSDWLLRAQCFVWADALTQGPMVKALRALPEVTAATHSQALEFALEWMGQLRASALFDEWVEIDIPGKGEHVQESSTVVAQQAGVWSAIGYAISAEVRPIEDRVSHARLAENAFAAAQMAVRLSVRRCLDTGRVIGRLEESALKMCWKALSP